MRPFRVLLVVSLFAYAACANGADPDSMSTTRGLTPSSGDAATPACNRAGAACCGAFCYGSLVCVDSVCESCGADTQMCCTGATPCVAGLVCAGGSCAEPAPVTPAPMCGALDAPCCASGVACAAGLMCTAGTCETAAAPAPAPGPACGDDAEPCCASGMPCTPGNLCVSGTCRFDGPPPAGGPPPPASCLELDMVCTTSSACCSGDCYMGYCDGPTPPPSGPPAGGDACAATTDCFDCTLLDDCGFCDGRCVTSTTGAPPAGCAVWSYLYFECPF